MSDMIAILALIVSALALVPSLVSNLYERHTFSDQVYQRFTQMWFDLDQVFIAHPDMHKYFYQCKLTGTYAALHPEDENYALGLCISELFMDVFQYSEPMERYLSKEDRKSYLNYKAMICNAPIVKHFKQIYKWSDN